MSSELQKWAVKSKSAAWIFAPEPVRIDEQAVFTLIQDTGDANSTYDSVKITGEIPDNSKIKIRVQVSNDLNNWSEWSNSSTFINNNTNMILTWNGEKPSGRYIKIEVTLELGDDNAKPKISKILVNWQKP